MNAMKFCLILLCGRAEAVAAEAGAGMRALVSAQLLLETYLQTNEASSPLGSHGEQGIWDPNPLLLEPTFGVSSPTGFLGVFPTMVQYDSLDRRQMTSSSVTKETPC